MCSKACYQMDLGWLLLRLQITSHFTQPPPLMMQLEISDITFLKSLTTSNTAFNILHYIEFYTSPTRFGGQSKLRRKIASSTRSLHFYFTCLPRLWNALPPLNLLSKSLSQATRDIKSCFHDQFLSQFNSDSIYTYHFLCPCHYCSSK